MLHFTCIHRCMDEKLANGTKIVVRIIMLWQTNAQHPSRIRICSECPGALRKRPREQVALKCLGMVPCCSVILGAVWNKLGARVVPKPSITMPRCICKSGRLVLENLPEKELILNVMLHEKCEANPHRCLIYEKICSFQFAKSMI